MVDVEAKVNSFVMFHVLDILSNLIFYETIIDGLLFEYLPYFLCNFFSYSKYILKLSCLDKPSPCLDNFASKPKASNS